VLLINLGEEREAVARVVKERRYAATVLLDPEGTAARAYSVHATPTVFLIGRNFDVVARAIGSRPWADPTGRAFLGTLLGQPGH
jgi:hypothetical protein